MTMRRTPYVRMRYPWTDDVVNAADVQSMASDIDQGLVATQKLAEDFSKFASVVVRRTAAQSIAKATIPAISFDSVQLNNGANSSLSNGAWFNAGAPTRLTAPAPCVVLACGVIGINFGAALGTQGCLQVAIGLNGATGAPGVQGSKWNPISTASGQQWASALSMWRLATGDFLELRPFWNGTPAGPFNTDTSLPPSLSLMMVALPAVA